MVISDNSSAALIAKFLRARGVSRVFALCGGHIMPIWMRLDAEGIRIIDVRDERAAVHMAQAHAELTGEIGVALVTAGPAVTNAMTGIANAFVSRAPVLVLSGTPPTGQENRGSLQDIDHTLLVRSITRYARTVRKPDLVLQELDEAVERAFGHGGDPGPVYLDFPTDTLRAEVPAAVVLEEHLRPKPRVVQLPLPDVVAQAVDLLWGARRPLVISGRGAKGAGAELIQFLDRLGAVYLDTGESRGIVPDGHPSVVNAVRGKVMGQADVVVTIGRRLDFQLAYGSPAVYGNAKFIRISDSPSELRDNRRGAVELLADPAATLAALVATAGNRKSNVDRQWADGLRAEHEQRAGKLAQVMRTAPPDEEGRIHPNFLLSVLQSRLKDDCILVNDGGDFLSFSRVGLSASTVLDPGPFGCIGVGVPYGISAALAFPNRQVVVATGDGSFGFNAIEIDTAVRHRSPVVIVVANNGAWQIEVHDQKVTHGKVVGTKLQFSDHAAMARAFGMYAERVEKGEDLAGALDRAFANSPALVDVVVSPEAVSSDAKSGLAWVPDLQPLAAWEEAEQKWRYPAR
ncbi:thiamine pyrophosphate-binding protein [Hyphomicrobium sp.]|uniref:thiamine pyrophosphate-binding protein n=1 Tax=Hyphomicrobium sp. TaxID=82 RepID=UPI0025BAAD60|nr:thiamine pyrophosphate-binding protein [Hyphomicrobium sp.]MCC7253981.1 thiamine pyrophosphate-binding protein [Hyphomicrobium sp.]